VAREFLDGGSPAERQREAFAVFAVLPVPGALASGQWRAMRDGNDGIPGNHGNRVSASYRF